MPVSLRSAMFIPPEGLPSGVQFQPLQVVPAAPLFAFLPVCLSKRVRIAIDSQPVLWRLAVHADLPVARWRTQAAAHGRGGNWNRLYFARQLFQAGEF